jgi:acetolactate synthase-1/2/3 large subunit
MVSTRKDALLGGHVKLKTTAEHLVYLLGAHRIEYLFLNPGTDTAPVQEAVYTLAELGLPAPTVLLSTFESVSLAAAHAYWNMTGRPQAVFVHVDAGTQNLGAMVHNVLRGRAGVVVIAGKTPYGEEEGPSGGRNAPIQWLQDVPDQPGVIRSYAKWVQEITRPEMLDRAIGRAVQVAASSPAGMAYLTVSRDVLMDPPRLDHSRVAGFPVPVPAAPDTAAVAQIAAALAAAEAPVLVTSRVGRTAKGFAAVEALADLAGLPVTGRLDTGTVNISSAHPASLPNQAAAAAAVSAADAILVVESDVPWLPARVTLRADAKVFHVDPDPAKVSMPLWSYPVDLAVQADGAAGLAAITAALAEIAAAQPAVAKRLADRVAAQRERAAVRPGPAPLEDPLTPLGVMSALSQVIDAEDIVIEEAVTNASAVYEGLERTRPCTLTGPGAPGLGWALGGALGVKLARPDRRVITVSGDGSFLFGVPTSALMMAAEWGTPFLAVILNNKGYRASRLPVYGLFPDGASAARKTAVGTRFNWAPDYPALAAACHAHGERVEKAEDLVPALRRALEAVDAGRAAVVECVTEQD